MLRITIGILAILFTLSEGRFFGSHTKNNLQSQDASDIAPVAEFTQHEYKGYIYHEGDEYHDNKDGAISGAQMIIRKKIAASLRTHFGKLQSVLTAFADDDGFVREGIVFCGAGRDESGALLEEPTMPDNFHNEGARLIEYDGWGVIEDADAADLYNKAQCGKNNCNEGSAVASIANEIRASGYQIHHKDICEAKATTVSLSSRSANMKPYAESKAIVCANPYWYERLQDCIGIATDDAGDGEINCGSKCTIRKSHAGTDADGDVIVIDDAEYEDKMCWVDFDAIPDNAGCARPGDTGASEKVNAKSPENIQAETSVNGIRRAMRYSLNAEVSVQTTDYAYFTGCQTDACLSLRQLFAALNGNAQISAFRDLGMEEAAAYWRDQIASIKTYLQSLADTFTDFREVSLDIFPYIENEEIVGCPMGEIEHAMGETGTDTQPLCYEIANTKRKLNEQSRDGQFISRGECACRNGQLSDDVTNLTGYIDTTELSITSDVEADYIYLYYTMPEGTKCNDYPTSVSTYCKQTDWHGGDWEETLLALIPNATTTRTKIYPRHSVHGIATTHAEREVEIAERRQAIQDALVGTLPAILDTSCGRIINADSGVLSNTADLLVSNKGGNCFPFPKMHEIIYRLEFETSEQGTGTYTNALDDGSPSGENVDERFCAEKVADTELSFRQLAYRFKNKDDGGNQLKNEDTFSGSSNFDTHLDYLVYTNEQTYNNGTEDGVLVNRTFCVVNWLKEFGVRTLEDSTGEEFQDPFGLFEKEIAEAVFNTELAQSTKSKVVVDNILIWKAIRKELTTASDNNILDDIAERAADHYLYVVSTDEDLIEPSTFRDAELVKEEVAMFAVQTAELAIEIKTEVNNMPQTVVEVLQLADEKEATSKANELVQNLLDYVASMTNAGHFRRRALHSSRKLAAGDKIGALSDPTLEDDGNYTCSEHHGYSFPGNCEQLTYYTYTGQGCFDSDVEVQIGNAAHYNKSACLALTNTWKNQSASGVWPIDDLSDRQHRAWTNVVPTNEDTTPQRYQWKASAGTIPDITWFISVDGKLIENSGYGVTAADRRRYRDPSNWELEKWDEVAADWTLNQAAVGFAECDNNGLDGVSKYGAVGGADSCYIGSGTYKPGCIFVPITPTAGREGTCVDCVKKNGGYHYTGGNSFQSAADAKCVKTGTCSEAASLTAGGSGQCPDTGKCDDCFGATDMAMDDELSTADNWAAGILVMASLKDAVKSNTDQCSTDHGALANFACDANNANNYDIRVQGYKAVYADGDLPADVVVTFPTRTNFTDNIVSYIVDETVEALNAWKADIQISRETIKQYANNRAHAHHENETKTKEDIQAQISILFHDGLGIQNKLKESFTILKEYQQNYDSNEDFWGDATLVQWPDTSTYLTETGQTGTLASKQSDGEDVSLPVESQDFSLALFPTADELKVQCQSKIADLYYDDVTKTYTDFEEEHAAMTTNAETGTGDATLQELFENQRDAFQAVIDACNDQAIAAKYGVDDAHEVNGQKRTQTYIDTIDAACKDEFPFGSAIPCYRQRYESRQQHTNNEDFMTTLGLGQTGALDNIKTRTGQISTTTAAAGNSYITTRNQVASNVITEFRTLSAFADGDNDNGLTISEVAAKNADLVWSAASSAEKFAYKLSTAAAANRTACIAIRAQAAAVIKSAGEALSPTAVTICDNTCTVSNVLEFITSRADHADLENVDNDPNFVNLAAFQKIETDLQAIQVPDNCYVAGRVQIETMLTDTGATAGGVKDISIRPGSYGGNPTYEVNCYAGYTLTNDGKCELDDCTGNQYTVLASDVYDPHNSGLANVNVAASAAAGGIAVCKNCPAGKKGDAASLLCEACPANSYNPNSNGDGCVAIGGGSVGTPLNGQTDGFTGSVGCDLGKYQTTTSPYDSMPVCMPCDHTSFSALTATTSCSPVPTGYQRGQDGKSQVQCLAGFFSLGLSNPCASCPQGKISSQDGAHECTQCIAGKYASGFASGAESNRGATECTSVSKGYSSNVAESERYEQNDGGHMTKCSGALYSMHAGETACATCPAGKIVASDLENPNIQTSCTDCDGTENIQCTDGINKVDCGTTDPNHADANNRNTHSVYGEWNDDGDAATACAPKSCSCSTDDINGLGVVQYVVDNNGGWKTQAITALGNVALGDVCRLGNGVALGGGDGDNNAGANKAQVVGCSECASEYGYDVLLNSTGNKVQGTKADGTTYDVHICQKCPQGANTAGSGLHKTQCTSETCPSGQGYPQTVFADAEPPYSYLLSDTQAAVCQFCNAGEYSDVNSFSDCLTIPSGFQCIEVHNAAGKILTPTDLSVPKNSEHGCSQIDICPAGEFRHNHDATDKRSRFGRCNPIPAGSYCSKFFADDGTVATGVTIGCGEISACPAGEYSFGNGAACVAIPAGKRCKSALKIVEGCDTADYGRDALNCNAFNNTDETQKIFKIYSHGDAVNVAAGFVNGTGGHLSSTFDLSTTTEPDIGCQDVEDCPAGEYYKVAVGFPTQYKMTCQSIPAGQRCSYNNVNTITTGGGVADGTNDIDVDSTGCEDVEDCAALHFTDSRKNICNKFTVCGEGKRVKTLGVQGTQTIGGTQATGAGSNSECSQCKLPDGNLDQYVAAANTDDDVGWNGDEDNGSVFGNGCQDWTPCTQGQYLAVDKFGTITADKGDCVNCDYSATVTDPVTFRYFYMKSDSISNGISQQDSNGGTATGKDTCKPGPTCLGDGEGTQDCQDNQCPCKDCGVGQSGVGATCVDCPIGTKDGSGDGSGACVVCANNEYQDTDKQVTCKAIGAGDQCKTDTTTACQEIEECLKGTYATATMHRCEPILAGQDCATIKTNNNDPSDTSTGCEAQVKCASTQYSTGGQNNCASIPVGHKCSTYYNDDGTVATGVTTGCGAITACADNEFSASGSAICTTITNCGVGHYIDTAPLTETIDDVVRYKSQRVCTVCPTGRHRDGTAPTAASTIAEVVVDNTVCSECSDCVQGSGTIFVAPTGPNNSGKGTDCNKGGTSDSQGVVAIDGTDKTCIPFACVTNCNPGMATDGTDSAEQSYNAATCQADEGTFDCGSCRAGYHVDTGGNPHTCVANQCGCQHGTGKLTDHAAGDATVVTCLVDKNNKAAEYDHATHQDCAVDQCAVGRVLVTVYGRGRCDTIACTCADGTAEIGDACGLAALSNVGNAKCSACDGGTKNAFVLNADETACDACKDEEYRIDGTDTECQTKVFTCKDGDDVVGVPTTGEAGLTGIADLDHGDTHCSSCNANYVLDDNNECVACDAGKYRTQGMPSCDDKVFVCKNGETVVGMAYDVDDVTGTQKANLLNLANHCASCTVVTHSNSDTKSGYRLDIDAGGNTCEACADGKKATDPISTSCELITCECDNGTPAKGDDVDFSGCGNGAKCFECDTGYDLADDTDASNNVATHEGQCIKACACENGTGARGTECFAAGQGDCTECYANYGYYVDGNVGKCLKCDEGAFGTNNFANDVGGQGACALKDCDNGKGFGNINLGDPMTSAQWTYYHTIWTDTGVNAFRGGDSALTLTCSPCPVGQFSGSNEVSQCQPYPDDHLCSEWIDSGSAGSTGCKATVACTSSADTLIIGATAYTVSDGNVCTATACASPGFTLVGGDCKADCTGTLSTDSGALAFVNNCCTDTDVDCAHDTVCTASCTDSTKVADMSDSDGYQNKATCENGSFDVTISVSCKTKDGENCANEAECLNGQCWAYFSGVSANKCTSIAPPKCSGFVSCDAGNHLKDSPANINCLTGTCTSSVCCEANPTCDDIDGDNTNGDNTAFASCDTGYQLKTDLTGTCAGATCDSSDCCTSDCTGNIANGGTGNDAYTTDCAASDVASGDDCTLTCDTTGYSGTSAVTCTAGTFATTDAPTCNPDPCTGNIAADGLNEQSYTTDCAASDVASGDDCTLTCDTAGYSGTSAVTCFAGTFDATVAPTCSADPCTGNIANGGTGNDAYTSSCSDSVWAVNSGGLCALTCTASGYSGTSTVLCTAGTFATTVAPTCTANPTCDDIDGDNTNGDNTAFASGSCDTGYQLKSDLTGTCAGATCASSDCCSQTRKCNDIDGSDTAFASGSCEAGFNGLKTDQHVNCVGDACVASDCCNAITCDGTVITYTDADTTGSTGAPPAYGSTITLTCEYGRACGATNEFAVYTCGGTTTGSFTATTAWNHVSPATTCPTTAPTGCA